MNDYSLVPGMHEPFITSLFTVYCTRPSSSRPGCSVFCGSSLYFVMLLSASVLCRLREGLVRFLRAELVFCAFVCGRVLSASRVCSMQFSAAGHSLVECPAHKYYRPYARSRLFVVCSTRFYFIFWLARHPGLYCLSVGILLIGTSIFSIFV